MLSYEAHLSSDVPRLMRLLTSAHPTIVGMEDNRQTRRDLDYDKEGNIVELEVLNASQRVENPRGVDYAVTS